MVRPGDGLEPGRIRRERSGKHLGFMATAARRATPAFDDTFEGRPLTASPTWSELHQLNIDPRALAEHVKRGIWQAGGVPFEFPTTSAGEPLVRPTAMLLRNLMAIYFKTLRLCHLLHGERRRRRDKTTPATCRAPASVDLPTLLITGGPMLNGKYRGTDIGSGTSVWRFTEAYRAGQISAEEVREAEGCMARSQGHCMTMGTASTMACVSEYMGSGSRPGPPRSARTTRDARPRRTSPAAASSTVAEDPALQLHSTQVFENGVANAALGGYDMNAALFICSPRAGVGVEPPSTTSTSSATSRCSPT